MSSTFEVNEDKKIINAGASEFSDIWQNYCLQLDHIETTCNCDNPLESLSVTAGGLQLEAVLTDLINTGKFYLPVPATEGELLYLLAEGAYYHGYTPTLREIHAGSSPYNVKWYTSPLVPITGGFTFSGFFHPGDETDQTPFCILNFKLTTTATVESVEAGLLGIAKTDAFGGSFNIDYPTEDCEDITLFNFNLSSNTLPMYFECTSNPCIVMIDCFNEATPVPYCSVNLNENGNPFLLGIEGIWKPKTSYAYVTDRTYTSPVDTKADGFYSSFSPFWEFNTSLNTWVKNDAGWQRGLEAVFHDPRSGGLENQDPLNVFSSSTYGFNFSAQEMITQNAKVNEIGFESFEDELFVGSLEKECNLTHFDWHLDNSKINPYISHTGNYSYEEGEDDDIFLECNLTTEEYTPRTSFTELPFTMRETDCLPVFSPNMVVDYYRKYIITLWLKREDQSVLSDVSGYTITATIDANNCLSTEINRSEYIDGWQRIEYSFTIPIGLDVADPNLLEIQITNNESTSLYIDDLRIQPFNALATCYVYDDKTMRLMAQLDENHFATFFEYDSEGLLVRTNRETEKGIVTIEEARYNTPKK